MYLAYGLCFRSALSLPELVRCGGRADVAIRVESLREVVADLQTQQRSWRVAPDEVSFFWEDIGAFAVRDGREILVDPHPGVDQRWIRLGILGPALAALLQQRGFLILHASAVNMGGVAVAFLGSSGWGKSTLAATLHARGHSLLADDVVAIRFDSDHPAAFPGFPQFKLWPDALAALGNPAATLPRVNPGMDKRARSVSEGFNAGDPLPVARIYLLSRGESLAIEGLRPSEAFLELVTHSYGIDWLHPISGPDLFSSRAELVRRVPVRCLTRPWNLDSLSAIADAVEEDLAFGN